MYAIRHDQCMLVLPLCHSFLAAASSPRQLFAQVTVCLGCMHAHKWTHASTPMERHTHTHRRMNVCAQSNPCIHMHACSGMHMPSHTHTHTHTPKQASACTQKHTHTKTSACMHTQTHTHTHTHLQSGPSGRGVRHGRVAWHGGCGHTREDCLRSVQFACVLRGAVCVCP